jgi:hypothetical protein
VGKNGLFLAYFDKKYSFTPRENTTFTLILFTVGGLPKITTGRISGPSLLWVYNYIGSLVEGP